jgi:parallel beta-helix repeat protein
MLAALAIFAVTAPVLAGPIDPPPGPVAPTPGPEPRIPISDTTTPGDADSLYRIGNSGSYYLTGNITGVAGKKGIEVAGKGVTIDLNGFSLIGVPNSLAGISAFAQVDHLAVFNGRVDSWGGEGITATPAASARLHALQVRNCLGGGINAFAKSVITDCTAENNGGTGITAGPISTVTRCAASGSGTFGIFASNGSTISQCTATGNTQAGIAVTSESIAEACTARFNFAEGITANEGSIVRNCMTSRNNLDGISATNACTISGNACDNNGNGTNNIGAGIKVAGTNNRIEGNQCTVNDRGIQVDGAGNFIARNTCSDNRDKNWIVAIGNICLVVQGAPTTVLINGNTGGLAPGSTDPNANFTY